jgi:hypothetical protein
MEPYRIKTVEPLRFTTRAERMRALQYHPFKSNIEIGKE